MKQVSDAARGADGLARCPWALSAPDYGAYHDQEWGTPTHGLKEVFERLTLEGFQSGLSWLIILRKRENFRRAFAGFELDAVAAMGQADIERLLGDAGIVRNRLKIEATINNARATIAMSTPLDEVLWAYAQPHRPPRRTLADVPGSTPESLALSKQLKKLGFRFIGPTTAYSAMQAMGVVNDHLVDCWRSTAADQL
ncbi:MAG: DNA-3-methyladenine glycosylase I [Antricoccus sp.]